MSGFPGTLSWQHRGILFLSLILLSTSERTCPCLTSEELPPLNNLFLHTPSGYGIGCDAHDATQELCIGNRREGTWCQTQWCYVDPQTCELTHSLSRRYSGVAYSYAACGHVDEYVREASLLKGVVLRGVMHENYRGYQGTICPTNQTKECYGTFVEFATYLVELSGLNVSIDFVEVPELATQRANNYGPFVDNHENMDHGACVYATSLSMVDVCIGAFTMNQQRVGTSSFIEMGVTSEYVVVTHDVTPETLPQMVDNIFEPFSVSLWVTTFAVLILLSVLLAVQESSCHGWSWESSWLAIYNAFLGFFAGESQTRRHREGGLGDDDGDPLTWGGRLTLLAIAVQILLAGASYTANLTNFLVRNGLTTGIVSMEDAIGKTSPVCVLRNKISVLETTYGKGVIRFAINPNDGMPGFPDRSELLPAMDEGLCDCAVVSEEELAVYHGSGKHCDKNIVGLPVIELPFGFPVSEKYEKRLATTVARFMQSGKWRRLTNQERPESICPEIGEIDSETMPLKPRHMLGAYALSGALAVLGTIVSLAATIRNKNHKQSERCSPKEIHNKPVPGSRHSRRTSRSKTGKLSHSESVWLNSILSEDEARSSESEDEEDVAVKRLSAKDPLSLHVAVENLRKEVADLRESLVSESNSRHGLQKRIQNR